MSPTGNAIDQPNGAEAAMFLMAGVFYVALFAWLAVTGWAAQRRRERESTEEWQREAIAGCTNEIVGCTE